VKLLVGVAAVLASIAGFAGLDRQEAQAWEPKGACAEWWPVARNAGFRRYQWPTINRIMYAESRCNPSAYNPSGARGLMQIMPMWADDCGRYWGVVGWPDRLFRPRFNLRCAFYVKKVQGWTAWMTY
jgi:transglycosylase-like protein with SLT domain